MLAAIVLTVLAAIAGSAHDATPAAHAGTTPRAAAEPAPIPGAVAAVLPPAVGDSGEASFPVVLGSFSTTLIGSLPARNHNVRLATAALDGVVLEPGAELSFNDRVGPRTADRGYLVAPVILREQRLLELGGGICQVASTVFDAALVAGLTPVERYRHSSPVDYVALGEDATIAWGYKDLRIRNDYDQSVRLRVEVVGATLLVRVQGEQPSGHDFALETDERDVPPSSDQNLPGHEVELYRVERVNGDEVGREFMHRDLYPSARIRPQ